MSEKLKPGPCPFCGSAVDLLLLVKDDDNKYPRPHWHVSIECPCGATIGWEVVSEQLPDQYSPNDKKSPVIMERVNAYIARWNAAGQDTKRLDWYLGASASPPSIEDWIRGMKEGWTPTQWRAWIDQRIREGGHVGNRDSS